MKALLSALTLAIALGACASGAPAPATPSAPEDPAAVITPQTIYDRLYFIASDALAGRDTPSPGLEAAAAYLVSEHRRMGLEPGYHGSYYQRWPYYLTGTDVESASVTLEGSSAVAFEIGRNAAVSGAAEGSLRGELVFVPSIEGQPAAGSLTGRVAVFTLPAPDGWNQQVGTIANRQAQYAAQAGAVTTLHLLTGGVTEAQVEAMARQFATPRRAMGHEPPMATPRLFVTEEAFVASAPAQADLIASPGEGHRAMGVRLAAEVPLRFHDRAEPPNVVAVIPGSDPELRDEYVVLSAHFDHVGIGRPDETGDSIYNGADDNGSGTVVLVETARAIMEAGIQPRRSIMFVHVSGEERGLLGSRWFVDNAPIPVENMVANINADMVAGDQHRDTLVVIGKEYSTLGPLVDRLNDGMPDLGLITSDDIWPEQRFFFRSDQLNFMRAEIPSLFFFTGVHECYHRPCDTVDFVSTEKAARVARLLVHTVLAIADEDARPEWTPDGLAEVRERTGGRR